MAGHRHASVLGALDDSDIIDVGAGDGLTHGAIQVVLFYKYLV